MQVPFSAFGLFLFLLPLHDQFAHAFPSNKRQVPNGDQFLHLGHTSSNPSFSDLKHNAFGAAFNSAAMQWTAALCQADSDGDGFTNGEELGDPNCTWQQGQPMPDCGGCPSHPGDAEDNYVCGSGVKYCGLLEKAEDRYRAHGALMLTAWVVLAPLLIAMVFVRRKIQLMDHGQEDATNTAAFEMKGGGNADHSKLLGRLMLIHKIGQPLTLIITTVAITLPFLEDHSSHGHRRRLSGGHSSMSMHGILGFLVLSLAWSQLFLWLGKKWYLQQNVVSSSEVLESNSTKNGAPVVVNGLTNNKITCEQSQEIALKPVVQKDFVEEASGGNRAAAAKQAAESSKSFSEKWLWVHRISGLLCLLLGMWNCVSGAFKFEDMFDDTIFQPVVYACIVVSLVLLLAARTLGHKLVTVL
ncbi:unnamed protein product [Amoebophrya sp. A120]|nr:unnamed protein product [Amoebophrya sp. A120]|eukprot:GSA120T00010347001.1